MQQNVAPPVVLTDNDVQEWIDAWLLAQAVCCLLHNALRHASIAKTQ